MVPLIGGGLRRLAARVTGRPSEELALSPALLRPRLAAAGGLTLTAFLSLVAALLAPRYSGIRVFRRSGIQVRRSRTPEHVNT